MTKEEKDLLLKDLCARLPYGVNCEGFYYEEPDYKTPYEHLETCKGHVDGIDHIGFDDGEVYIIIEGIPCELLNVKPYLRPMSSMTEEESAELSNIIGEWFDKELFYLTEEPFLEYALSRINYSISPLLFDWLNKHHFDYRGLIPKDLAIEVTEDNNPYKN